MVDNVWLTSIILQHVDACFVLVLGLRAVKRVESQLEVLCFYSVLLKDDNDVLLGSHGSVVLDEPFAAHLVSDASRVFRTPRLHPKQEKAIEQTIFGPSCDGNLILVDKTGGVGSVWCS